MAASKQLSDQNVTEIIKIITQWPLWRPFGWEELRGEIKVQFKFSDVSKVWTRQQLPKYPGIKDAYAAKKLQIRKHNGQETGGEEMPPVERKLRERIAALETETQTLRAENDLFHERFERWLYNANVKGVRVEVLDLPLPSPSKKPKKKGKVEKVEKSHGK